MPIDSSFARGAQNLAAALFPDPRQQAAMAQSVEQTAALRQQNELGARNYRSLQSAADNVRRGGDYRMTVADVLAGGDPRLLNALPETRLSLVANDPNASDNDIIRAGSGAGIQYDSDNAFSVPGQNRISARNADEDRSLRGVVNAGNLATQRARNEGALSQQYAADGGRFNRLKYETNNPDTVEGVFAQQMRGGDLSPEQAAYLRYGKGPQADTADAANTPAGPSGPEPLDVGDAVNLDKLAATLGGAVDADIGLVFDENGGLVDGAPLPSDQRAAWVQTALNLMQQSGYRLGTDQAVQMARQQVFPDGLDVTPASGTWPFNDVEASVKPGGQVNLNAASVFDPPANNGAGDAGGAPQTAQTPQTGNPLGSSAAVVATMPNGQTFTQADIEQTAARRGVSAEEVIQLIVSKGGALSS